MKGSGITPFVGMVGRRSLPPRALELVRRATRVKSEQLEAVRGVDLARTRHGATSALTPTGAALPRRSTTRRLEGHQSRERLENRRHSRVLLDRAEDSALTKLLDVLQDNVPPGSPCGPIVEAAPSNRTQAGYLDVPRDAVPSRGVEQDRGPENRRRWLVIAASPAALDAARVLPAFPAKEHAGALHRRRCRAYCRARQIVRVETESRARLLGRRFEWIAFALLVKVTRWRVRRVIASGSRRAPCRCPRCPPVAQLRVTQRSVASHRVALDMTISLEFSGPRVIRRLFIRRVVKSSRPDESADLEPVFKCDSQGAGAALPLRYLCGRERSPTAEASSCPCACA